MGHYSSFIVRLWVDPPEGFRWGLIQHVGSQDEQRFNTLQDMLDFMLHYSETAELSIPFSLNSSSILPSQDGSGASGAQSRQASRKKMGKERSDREKGRDPGLDTGGV